MNKFKLSPKQHTNIKAAVSREQQTGKAFQIAQAQAAEASNHRLAILEMIFEAHGVEMPAADVRINISDDGYLSFSENGKASKRIKGELQRAAVKRGQDKKAKMKVAK